MPQKRQQKRKPQKKITLAYAVILVLLFGAYAIFAFSDELGFGDIPVFQQLKQELFGEKTAIEGDCEVHFIDVGQGDANLIIADGKVALIDAGENDKGKVVVDYLKNLGITKIDLLFMTHPHSDHIGGMDIVINELDIDKIIMPKLPEKIVPTTRTYTDVLKAIAAKKLKITPSRVGDSYSLGNGSFTVLGPTEDYDDLNNTSLVCRFVYGDKSFLFTGDMEKSAESDLIDSGGKLASDVLKAGHHGSSTSSSKKFYQSVNPVYCVISAGSGNSYGHPHKETLSTFQSGHAEIYRTDYQGSIIFQIHSGEMTIRCEKQSKK